MATLVSPGRKTVCHSSLSEPKPLICSDRTRLSLWLCCLFGFGSFACLHSVKHYNNENLCESIREHTQHCQALNINSENTVTNSESVRNQEQRGQD